MSKHKGLSLREDDEPRDERTLVERVNDGLRAGREAAQAADNAMTDGWNFVTVHCVFNQGPKHGESVDISVPMTRGHPQEITVVAVDPETLTMREGLYRQSAINKALYVWVNWTGTAQPIVKG